MTSTLRHVAQPLARTNVLTLVDGSGYPSYEWETWDKKHRSLQPQLRRNLPNQTCLPQERGGPGRCEQPCDLHISTSGHDHSLGQHKDTNSLFYHSSSRQISK